MCEWLERCDDLVQVLDCHFSKILSPKTSILAETLRELGHRPSVGCGDTNDFRERDVKLVKPFHLKLGKIWTFTAV